jgi:LCP family protein required for cell wall assembly
LPDDKPVRPGRALWTRYLIGTLLIVFSVASATAVAFVREVDTVVDAFRDGAGLDLGPDLLAEADVGKPQTILLIGSDQRAKGARDAVAGARSDTLILVRMDPTKHRTALLSLPRDLKVEIPGHGTDKINAAYSFGGPKLTLKTVKQLTGLTVNHVVNVDFKGFRAGVDSIGCVFIDVDRHYFNNNVGVAMPYATIDVPQGYQKVCGQDALDYVRYRHEDTDIVRGARQQDFLRQAKDQVGVGKVIEDRRELTKIFGKYTESDIRSRKSVVRLLRLVAASAANPIVEVRFEGDIGPSFVTASQRDVNKMTEQFLGTKASKGPRGELEPRDPKKRKRVRREAGSLEMARDAGKQQALAAITAGVRGWSVFYPTQRISRSTFAYPEPRVYEIKVGRKRYQSYRMVIKRNLLGEYYGLQGTTWKNPPILKGPDEKRKLGGREYEIFKDGDRVRLVAWRTPEAVYWVSNTLLQTLSSKQMLSIARSARRLE